MPSLHKFLVVGGIAIAAFAIVAIFQRNVMPIPVIGNVLPR